MLENAKRQVPQASKISSCSSSLSLAISSLQCTGGVIERAGWLVAAMISPCVFTVELTTVLGTEGREEEDTVIAGAEFSKVRETLFERGRGRVGPEAVPTGLPTPGNLFLDGNSVTAGTATTDLAEGVADTANLEIEDEATETAAV